LPELPLWHITATVTVAAHEAAAAATATDAVGLSCQSLAMDLTSPIRAKIPETAAAAIAHTATPCLSSLRKVPFQLRTISTASHMQVLHHALDGIADME
jgi:hypothetical protein